MTLAPGEDPAVAGLHLWKAHEAGADHAKYPGLWWERAMTALCPNSFVTGAELETVEKIFQSFGKTEVVPEPLIDVVVGASGSSPAYVFLFIEALADAAVADGMPRAQAYEFAAQSVLGSRKNGAGDGKTSGRTEGYGLLSGRHHHGGCAGSGGKRIPQRGDGSFQSLRKKSAGIVKILKAWKQKNPPGNRDNACLFPRGFISFIKGLYPESPADLLPVYPERPQCQTAGSGKWKCGCWALQYCSYGYG